MEREAGVLNGVLAAHGAHGAKTQKLARALCDAGRVQEVLIGLARFLVEEGMRKGQIPENAGVRDRELQDIAEQACLVIANSYRTQGGVLLAKGYASEYSLANVMLQHWAGSFRAPVPVTKTLGGGLSPEELNDRACIATLCAKKKLEEMIVEGRISKGDGTYNENTLSIPPDAVESLLRRIVKATIWAFDDPNAAQHWLLHGESSDEKTS